MMHGSLNTPQGLSLLKTAPIPARGNNRHYPLGTILGNYLYVGDKPGGVEPGFLGIEINSSLIAYFQNHYPVKNIEIPDDVDEFKLFLASQMGANLDSFINSIVPSCKNGKNKELVLWLFKQDYEENPNDLNVVPPDDRLAKTNAIKQYANYGDLAGSIALSLYRKNRLNSRENESVNAVLECLANDIARLHGMNVQDQRLVFGTYQNGDIKILTACRWDPNLEFIEGKIRGSMGGKYEGYITAESQDSELISRPIKNLSEYLALFISQGDRDALGSQGQNKALRNGELFGYDFGHAYRERNKLLASLSDDFSFIQPRDVNEKYKNFSIFYDSLMSERMLGVFYIYQLADKEMIESLFTKAEQVAIHQAIQAYKIAFPHFKIKMEKLEAFQEREQRIFDGYWNYFSSLRDACMSEEQKNQYTHILDNIEEAKSRAKEANMAILSRFRAKLQLTPSEVDLVQNVEKLLSGTSLTSNNGQVKLNHLRILPKSKVSCELVKTKDSLKLILDFKNLSEEAKLNAVRILRIFLEKSLYLRCPQIQYKNNTIILEHDLILFSEYKKLFTEKNIIEFKNELGLLVPANFNKNYDSFIRNGLKGMIVGLSLVVLAGFAMGLILATAGIAAVPFIGVTLASASSTVAAAIGLSAASVTISGLGLLGGIFVEGVKKIGRSIYDWVLSQIDNKNITASLSAPLPSTSSTGEVIRKIGHPEKVSTKARMLLSDACFGFDNLIYQRPEPMKTDLKAIRTFIGTIQDPSDALAQKLTEILKLVSQLSVVSLETHKKSVERLKQELEEVRPDLEESDYKILAEHLTRFIKNINPPNPEKAGFVKSHAKRI